MATATNRPNQCRDCFGTGRNRKGGPCKTCRGTGHLTGGSAGLQAVGALFRLLMALLVIGIIVAVVIAAISGGGSSSKHRSSNQNVAHTHHVEISVTSTCADWARASGPARLTFGGAAAPGNARAVAVSIGLFCLKAKLHHRALALVPIGGAPVLSGP